MDRKDLLKKELRSFVETVKAHYHPDKIILFGSLASGRVSDMSDLDLIIVAESKDDFWSRLQNLSKYCSRKVGMDVLFYTPAEFNRLSATRTFFKKEIKEKGEVVYDKAGTS